MSTNLEKFRNDFLHAFSWPQRKDGVPLRLLDKLSPAEQRIAEAEMLQVAGLSDTWPVIGLGHIGSQAALPKLYALLRQSEKETRITIAHSIFQISQDAAMIDIVLQETPLLTSWYALIDILYMLPDFNDERIMEMLRGFRGHKEYLVAYNAERALL